MRIALVAAALSIAAATTIAAIRYRAAGTPEHSIARLREAFARRDPAAVRRFFDVDRVCDSMIHGAAAAFTQSALGNPRATAALANHAVARAAPALKARFGAEFDRRIQDGRFRTHFASSEIASVSVSGDKAVVSMRSGQDIEMERTPERRWKVVRFPELEDAFVRGFMERGPAPAVQPVQAVAPLPPLPPPPDFPPPPAPPAPAADGR